MAFNRNQLLRIFKCKHYSSRETVASAKFSYLDSTDNPREYSLVLFTLYSFIHFLSSCSSVSQVLTGGKSVRVLSPHQIVEKDCKTLGLKILLLGLCLEL
jgi:hypothetical protein